MKLTFRIWVLLIVLGLSVLAISPSLDTGVVVESVERNSSIFEAGLREGAVIKAVNGEEVIDIDSYGEIINDLFGHEFEQRIDITTKDNEFTILTDKALPITVKNVPRTKIQTGLDLRGGSGKPRTFGYA